MLTTFFANAQKKSWDQPIPLNQKVRHGILKNKLHYYILNVDQPEDKVTIYFSVDAGIMDEKPDQAGMAHLLEHLGVDGSSPNFPEGLRQYFVERGLAFGGDIHASTSDLSTQYFLKIFATDTSLIRQGLLAFSDVAGRMVFNAEDVERERFAVFHEGARNPKYTQSTGDLKCQLLNSNPLYKVDLGFLQYNAMNSSPDSYMRFYRDWYHPANQAIIVVGRVDEQDIENHIKKYFSDLSNTGIKTRDKKIYGVKLDQKNRLLISRCSTGVEISLYKKREAGREVAYPGTRNEYKANMMDQLANRMVRTRIQAIDGRRFNPLILIDRNAIVSTARIDAIRGYLQFDSAHLIKPAVKFLLHEFRRLELHEFSEAELTEAKNALRETFAKIPAQNVLHRLLYYHQVGQAFPDDELQINLEVINQIGLEEVNALVRNWLAKNGNLDVAITAPQTALSHLPSQEEYHAWIAAQRKSNPERVVLRRVLRALPTLPQGISVDQCRISRLDNLNAWKMELPNGINVVLKSIPYAGEKAIINMTGFKQVNTGTVPSDNKILLQPFIEFDSLSVKDMDNWLKEKRHTIKTGVSFSPYIGINEVGVLGEGDPELVLKLTALYLTKGRLSQEDYLRTLESQNKFDNPDPFLDTLRIVWTNKSARKTKSPKVLTFTEIDQMYKEYLRLGNGYNIVITGSFDMERMKQLVARYLGTLPRLPETNKSVLKPFITSPSSPSSEVSNRVEMVGDGVGNVEIHMLFRGDCEVTTRNHVNKYLTRELIRNVLLNRLRFQEKGVYSINVNLPGDGKSSEFFIDVTFEAAPVDTTRLIAAVQDELHRLSTTEIKDEDFAPAVTRVKSTLSEKESGIYWWNDYLLDLLRTDSISTANNNSKDILDRITKAELSQFIRNHLDITSYKLFKLL